MMCVHQTRCHKTIGCIDDFICEWKWIRRTTDTFYETIFHQDPTTGYLAAVGVNSRDEARILDKQTCQTLVSKSSLPS